MYRQQEWLTGWIMMNNHLLAPPPCDSHALPILPIPSSMSGLFLQFWVEWFVTAAPPTPHQCPPVRKQHRIGSCGPSKMHVFAPLRGFLPEARGGNLLLGCLTRFYLHAEVMKGLSRGKGKEVTSEWRRERERERGRQKTENKMEEWPCVEKGRLLWRRRRNGRWRGVHGNVSSFLFSSDGGATADQWLDLGGGGGPGTKHPFDREPHRSPVEMLGSLVEPMPDPPTACFSRTTPSLAAASVVLKSASADTNTRYTAQNLPLGSPYSIKTFL